MPTESAYVYTWKDERRKLAYVFVGDEREPDRIWAVRKEFESDLNDWLRTLEKQPAVDTEHSLTWPTYQNRARSVKRGFCYQLEKAGYEILSPRDRATIKAGHKRNQPVYTPHGWFKSVRTAARAIGVTPSAITLACQNPNRDDYYYDTPANNSRVGQSNS